MWFVCFVVFSSLDMSRSNSMTSSGQCRLAPLILCIQDSCQLYDYIVKSLFRLHSSTYSWLFSLLIYMCTFVILSDSFISKSWLEGTRIKKEILVLRKSQSHLYFITPSLTLSYMDVKNFGKNETKNSHTLDFIISKYCCICALMF